MQIGSDIWMALLSPLFMTPFLVVFAVIPVVAYVVSRWRHSTHHDVPDPQLGLKAAWSYFKLVGFQAAVFGFFLMLYGALSGDHRGDALRAGASFFVPGAVVYAGHAAAMRRSNHRKFPHTMRMYSGLNMIILGMVGIIATIVALAVTLRQGSVDTIKLAWSLSVTYVLAWLLCTHLFIKTHVPTWHAPGADEGEAA